MNYEQESISSKFASLRKELREEMHSATSELRAKFETHTHKTDEIANSIAKLDSRLTLLFDEQGKGYFDELRQEVRKLNNKIAYASGALAVTYVVVNWLIVHGKL